MSQIFDLDGSTLLRCYPAGILASTVLNDLNASPSYHDEINDVAVVSSNIIALRDSKGQNYLSLPLPAGSYTTVLARAVAFPSRMKKNRKKKKTRILRLSFFINTCSVF
jgi:hypothetical protein